MSRATSECCAEAATHREAQSWQDLLCMFLLQMTTRHLSDDNHSAWRRGAGRYRDSEPWRPPAKFSRGRRFTRSSGVSGDGAVV